VKNEKEKARNLYNNFSGHDLNESEYEITIPDGTVVFPIGTLDGLMYTAIRDGKKEQYLHTFNKKSAPLLVSTSDGLQLFIVGGKYEFTETGINDRG